MNEQIKALLDVTLANVKRRNRNSAYNDNEEGYQAFMDKTTEYFRYIQECNDNNNKKVMPSIRGWCTYLGVTTQTVCNYEQRGGKWEEEIRYIKESISILRNHWTVLECNE